MNKARIRKLEGLKRRIYATPEGSLERQMLACYRRKHLQSKGVVVIQDQPAVGPHLLNILAALELEAEGKIIPVAGRFSKPWLTWSATLEPERILDVIRYQE